MNSNMLPILTDIAPFPQTLMVIMRCNSTAESDTMRCMCRKRVKDCSVVCGECRGVRGNISTIFSSDDSDDELSEADELIDE